MDLPELKDKVQRWLLDMGLKGIQITSSGGYSFRYGSTQVIVDIDERGEGENKFSTVIVTAPFLQNPRRSPELYEWIAKTTDHRLFGHLGLVEYEDGDTIVVFTHTLLGDYIDPEELVHTVSVVAGTADDIDDDAAARFGGEVFHSD